MEKIYFFDCNLNNMVMPIYRSIAMSREAGMSQNPSDSLMPFVSRRNPNPWKLPSLKNRPVCAGKAILETMINIKEKSKRYNNPKRG